MPKKQLNEAAYSKYSIVDLSDENSIRKCLLNHMIQQVGKDPAFASSRDWFYALAYLVRGVLSDYYIRTGRNLYDQNVKRVYYLSMEYLIGRNLNKTLIDLGCFDKVKKVLGDFGCAYDEIQDSEFDAALGNGGLGRLAACILDSLATHGYPGLGYGIRYEYGIFTQRIEHGQQVEHPENWLRYGNPWEFKRPSIIYPVRYNGRMLCFKNASGEDTCQWVDTDEVIAMAFDVPVSGYKSDTVSNLRLWSARSSRDFDLNYFNEGDYIKAVENKTASENLSKVLYPNDQTAIGQELRLKQEYFFVSATVQDVLSRFRRTEKSMDTLPDKVAMQLNDTHPAMAVPELMRLLIDDHGYAFDKAWDITTRTFSYTNHTLLPEALETWPVDMLHHVLPRHLELIFQINDIFLKKIRHMFPGDGALIKRMSLIDDERHCVRMAYLAIVGSHKVNGVAELHTKLLRTSLFADFNKVYPDKFINMTNGITPRRWLLQANPELAKLITEYIGDDWIKDLSQLKKLSGLAEDKEFCRKFTAIKKNNKKVLAQSINKHLNIDVDTDSMFDVQVKRIHEYKRQLLNALHVITRYNRLRDNPDAYRVKRTVIFGGKAAPGYAIAKLIIQLLIGIADIINNDPSINNKLKVIFIPNYDVTTAEVVIPGSDLSEQISTAGTEASGTGNMKFALNGALTIGTLDGANIEILEEVGEDNIFIFGLNAEAADNLRSGGYDARWYYDQNQELQRAIAMIEEGFFAPEDQNRYRPIVDSLLRGGDHYLLFADYASYIKCQDDVDEAFLDTEEWTRKSILNVANMGKFSSDRTIHSYATEIWNIKPIKDA